jgi:two-component system sensor histidine kinase RegB
MLSIRIYSNENLPMTNTPTTAAIKNVKRLAALRLITCIGFAVALVLLGLHKSGTSQSLAAWGIIFTMSVLSLLNLYRAHHQSIAKYEIFSYLLTDSLLIICLMYFTGGANNPFISYLLVPIVISAATLTWFSTWVLTAIAMTAYGLLLFFYIPLLPLDRQLAELGLSFHIVGMWFTFTLSALFIAYFVVEMALDLKYQEQQTAYFREQSIQNEHLMLLASQAASTAHEIGTPLTTLKVLSHELLISDELSGEKHAEARQDLNIMAEQINLCQMKLKKLTQQTHIEQSETQPLTDFIDMALQQWLLMRPLASFVVKGNLKSFKSSNLLTNVPTVQYPLVLQQAIINLLDNAADSNNSLNDNKSQMPINIELTYNNQSWTMSIQDNGNGIDKSFNLPNSPMISPNGLGIGLLLSHNSISRLGGSVSLTNNNLGCLTAITMPVTLS